MIPQWKRDAIARAVRTTTSYREIANRFCVSPQTVTDIAKEQGIDPRRNNWTEAEDELLRQNYRDHGARGTARMLPRHPNYQSVYCRAKQLGLSSDIGPYGRHSRLKVIEGGSCG